MILHWDHEPRLKGRCRASVLDCGSPLPLLRPRAGCESARGLAQSKISRCDGRFMQRSGRRRFAELASIALLLLVGVVPLPAADTGASDRKIPPPGIHIPDADRRELEAGAESLAREIESLRAALKDKPALTELLPDVQIFQKAVDWALRCDEFYKSNEVRIAHGLLAAGVARAVQLRNGETPWTGATGLVVRGFTSRLDGSVQPYGLIVPAAFVGEALEPVAPAHRSVYRLDIWLHGRDDHLSELKFISDRQKSYGEFAPSNTFVLHPYGRYCNAFKFAGEVDVLEALEQVTKHYPIDTNRIVLRGFSMGGAGAWHLGVHHAGQWAVVAPGAGFASTSTECAAA